MEEKIKLQELDYIYGHREQWIYQLLLLQENPFLYLEEYRYVPEEVYRFKRDEELHPAVSQSVAEEFLKGQQQFRPEEIRVPRALCIGIGTYRTEEDGELYLCVLLDRQTRRVCAWSFGVYRSGELARRALENLFRIGSAPEVGCTLLSSRNPVYQTEAYSQAIDLFPVQMRMTQKGTRGGAAVVSTYFSQLMRRRGSVIFRTWQEAADWLTWDIIKYNLSR